MVEYQIYLIFTNLQIFLGNFFFIFPKVSGNFVIAWKTVLFGLKLAIDFSVISLVMLCCFNKIDWLIDISTDLDLSSARPLVPDVLMTWIRQSWGIIIFNCYWPSFQLRTATHPGYLDDFCSENVQFRKFFFWYPFKKEYNFLWIYWFFIFMCFIDRVFIYK